MKINKIFETIGYFTMFFIFSIILYFILKITHKLPAYWDYSYILLITILIVLTGKSIKWWLN